MVNRINKTKIFIFFILVVIIFYTLHLNATSMMISWAGHPDDVREEPHDYFYLKEGGRANGKILNSNSGELIKTSCIESAKEYVKTDLIGKLVGETIINKFRNHGDKELAIGKILVMEYKEEIKEINIKECIPLAVPDPLIPYSEWKECICVFYYHIPGGEDFVINRIKEIDELSIKC